MREIFCFFCAGSFHFTIQLLTPSAQLHCIHEGLRSPRRYYYSKVVRSGDLGGQAIGLCHLFQRFWKCWL